MFLPTFPLPSNNGFNGFSFFVVVIMNEIMNQPSLKI